jgi:hypothetical protein
LSRGFGAVLRDRISGEEVERFENAAQTVEVILKRRLVR